MIQIENEIKHLIIESLNLEDVTVDAIVSEDPLFGEGLGLDSIDALEIGLVLQKKYKIRIDSKSEDLKKHFYSVRSIATFVLNKIHGGSHD